MARLLHRRFPLIGRALASQKRARARALSTELAPALGPRLDLSRELTAQLRAQLTAGLTAGLTPNWLTGTRKRDPGHWIPTIASRPELPGHPRQPVSPPPATKGRIPDGIPPGVRAPGYRAGAGENRVGGNLPPDCEVILENRSSAPPTAAAPARCESSRLGPAPDREFARSIDGSDGPHRQCSDCALRARDAILRRRVRWNL